MPRYVTTYKCNNNNMKNKTSLRHGDWSFFPTNKKHMEGVEVSKTVPEAMAWAEETTEEDWKARIPLLHEV